MIHTDHPQRPELKITVVGSVSGPISVLPERLRMVTVKTSEGATGEVTLLVRGGKTVNFEVARKPEKINVSIEPSDTAADRKGRYRVKVDVPKGTPPGYIDEEIIIKTDFPGRRRAEDPGEHPRRCGADADPPQAARGSTAADATAASAVEIDLIGPGGTSTLQPPLTTRVCARVSSSRRSRGSANGAATRSRTLASWA